MKTLRNIEVEGTFFDLIKSILEHLEKPTASLILNSKRLILCPLPIASAIKEDK